MSLTGKYISVKTVIAKVYRDLQLKDEDIFTDIIEWCAEALDFIHVYDQYKVKPGCIHISNYKGEIPCDFISLISAEYNGQQIRSSTHTFAPQEGASIYPAPYSYNQHKLQNVLLLNPSQYLIGTESFKFENGYCKASFCEGKIYMKYQALPIDEEGYPLIPDHISFTEALYWYIVKKWLYPKVLHGEISGNMLVDADQKWQWYCNQAGAEAMMPDLITLENIKRSYLSLKIRPNLFDNFYNDLNKNY